MKRRSQSKLSKRLSEHRRQRFGRTQASRPWSLVRVFAWQSAAVFVLIGIFLHFVIQALVMDQFRDHSEFHAQFVGEIVLQPQLLDLALEQHDSPDDRARFAAILRDEIIADDDAINHIVVWDSQGNFVTSDNIAHFSRAPVAQLPLLERARTQGMFSLDGHAPHFNGEPAAETTRRTFVPIGSGEWVIEVYHDLSPTLAASRDFTRTLDYGLAGGLLLLWTLSLPIARRAGRQLYERSRIDELTGLANRTALEEHLDRVAAQLDQTETNAALLFLNMDGFKRINDNYGHTTGDQVLREIAARLSRSIQPSDFVARFASDEFVIVVASADGPAVKQLAHKIQTEVRKPLRVLSELSLNVSIGMATARDRSVVADTLLRQAQAATYSVKGAGGGGFQVFDDDFRTAFTRRTLLENELDGAINRDELYLDFQPFFDLQGDQPTVVAVEALARWQHPTLGRIGPSEFIPLAERNGLIDQIGDWVLLTACQLLSDWQKLIATDQRFTVFVNLSAAQLKPQLLDVLDDCLARTKADPKRLGFEITETVMLDNAAKPVIDLLARLRARGCALAIDDFGTGYSSLTRLRATPLTLLKLDGIFVNAHSADRREAAILSAVSQLASEMGIEVLAEGIETPEQLETVRNLGFHQAQGFYLARPAEPASIDRLLRDTQHSLLHPN